MLFNSLQFFLFFAAVYTLYWMFNHRWQNRLLILASCLFYAAWNWKFLFVMFISISTDFICSQYIAASPEQKIKKRFLFLSIFVNLAVLGFFKYFNFFAENLQSLAQAINPSFIPPRLWKIILPVGVSFYTFEAISYTVDVYRGIMKPTRRYWDYVLFVIYFPHLVAGPIMRAKDFLPQITSPRVWRREEFYEGCYLIFWGLFEKVFVADNLAKIVDTFFSAGTPYNGADVWTAVYAFAFQIFCDFDGYSNIARGLGKCMGFDIVINFNLPYFSTNPMEFWRRWHISLSSWLRDYLYIPLGGNRGTIARMCFNLGLTMILGGLWHGAAWTFVLWGVYHGTLLIIYHLLTPWLGRIPQPRLLPLKNIFFIARIIFFFHLTCLGWLIFRAESVGQVTQMLAALAHGPCDLPNTFVKHVLFFVIPVLIVQIIQYRRNDLMAVLKWSTVPRAVFYVICFYLLLIFGVGGGKEFVYFQF